MRVQSLRTRFFRNGVTTLLGNRPMSTEKKGGLDEVIEQFKRYNPAIPR
nr:MAG TPA: hypothetical protein [Bacteriophage sp.]